MSLLHRDRRLLGRYDRRDRASPRSLYFDELEIEPQLTRLGIYPDQMQSRRGPFMDSRAVGHMVHPQFFDEESHMRRDHRRRNSSMEFGVAMRKLHKQIMLAENFYGEFQSQFDNDVESVKNYAKADLLTVLWRCKVKKGKEGAFAEGGLERFEGIARKVAHALQAAVESHISESSRPPQRASHKDSAKRLQGKVEIANDQIMELLSQATNSREYCEGLLSELEMLKALIDPRAEKNRGLYRGSEDEDEDCDAASQAPNVQDFNGQDFGVQEDSNAGF